LYLRIAGAGCKFLFFVVLVGRSLKNDFAVKTT
jgi:hypothetical protein